MNVRRGMFRFWVVGAVIYAIIGAFMVAEQVQRPYIAEKRYFFPVSPDGEFTPTNKYDFELSETHYVVRYPNEVSLFVPKGISKEIVAKQSPRFVEQHVAPQEAEIRDARRENLLYGLAGIIIPPLVVLAVGAAIGWAISGFRKA